VFIFAVLFGHY